MEGISSFRKYWFIYWLYWQEGLQQRASFLMERFRSLVVLLSFYSLWSALLAQKGSFANYDRPQMMTYVLGSSILRSLVFASRTSEIAGDINHGRLSAYLLKPVNYFTYTFSRDLSEKSINLFSSIIEVAILSWVFGIHFQWPTHVSSWCFFLASLAFAVTLYFLLCFIVGCWGFWTAESGGPRFLLELFLEFSAGAFFPLDILPLSIQTALKTLPSPYLIFFPMRIFLERAPMTEIVQGFRVQFFWIIGLAVLARWFWVRGVDMYGAEGS